MQHGIWHAAGDSGFGSTRVAVTRKEPAGRPGLCFPYMYYSNYAPKDCDYAPQYAGNIIIILHKSSQSISLL
jgi:hypothetical protein